MTSSRECIVSRHVVDKAGGRRCNNAGHFKMSIRILFLGDIVGRQGRKAVQHHISTLRSRHDLDWIVANAENASGGLGLKSDEAHDLLSAGCAVLTSGNHIWKYREIKDYISQESRLLRPANYPPTAPGHGHCVYAGPGGVQVAVINLLGRTYMQALDCPFQCVDSILASLSGDVKLILVDFHAEATSEKIAMAQYLDGRVSAVLGTHTHVQTNDARILPGGTAAITDAGMCGVQDSILGMEAEPILKRFVTGLPTRFKLASGEAGLRGAMLELDPETGKALGIEIFVLDP